MIGSYKNDSQCGGLIHTEIISEGSLGGISIIKWLFEVCHVKFDLKFAFPWTTFIKTGLLYRKLFGSMYNSKTEE